jgi:hypothetical protein
MEWTQVRAMTADGMSEREIAWRPGINPGTPEPRCQASTGARFDS